jgi:hypothetical protein
MRPNAPLTDIETCNDAWGSNWDTDNFRCNDHGDTLMTVPLPGDYVVNRNNWDGRKPNAGLAVLLADGETIKQTQPFARCVANGPGYSRHATPDVNLYGEGIRGAHGGSGLSAIGGAIRVGEFQAGVIRHVLKMNLNGQEAISGTGGGYRWPAVKADTNYESPESGNYYGGSVPELKMGALLAIRPDDFDALVASFESSGQVPATIIATALRDYGAYIVDTTAWDSTAIITEWGPDGRVKDEVQNLYGISMSTSSDNAWRRNLRRIIAALHVVNGNSDGNTGGGPDSDTTNRRAPMAPPFQ